jgi:hypothetical protein
MRRRTHGGAGFCNARRPPHQCLPRARKIVKRHAAPIYDIQCFRDVLFLRKTNLFREAFFFAFAPMRRNPILFLDSSRFSWARPGRARERAQSKKKSKLRLRRISRKRRRGFMDEAFGAHVAYRSFPVRRNTMLFLEASRGHFLPLLFRK